MARINEKYISNYNKSWNLGRLLREDIGDSGNLKKVEKELKQSVGIVDTIIKIDRQYQHDDLPAGMVEKLDEVIQPFFDHLLNRILEYKNIDERYEIITLVREQTFIIINRWHNIKPTLEGFGLLEDTVIERSEKIIKDLEDKDKNAGRMIQEIENNVTEIKQGVSTISDAIIQELKQELKEKFVEIERSTSQESKKIIQELKDKIVELENQVASNENESIKKRTQQFDKAVANARASKSELDKSTKENKDLLDKLKQQEVEIQSLSSELKLDIQEANETIKDVNLTVINSESVKYGKHFGYQAIHHSRNANSNFWKMLICIGIAFILAVLLFVGQSQDFSLQEGLSSWQNFLKFISEQNILLVLAIFSLLGLVIAHFSRNYSAEKNLENIYIQKQKAIDSHSQLLGSIQDTKSQNTLETQNALISYMARSMFEVRNTGYLKKSNDSSNGMFNPGISFTKGKDTDGD